MPIRNVKHTCFDCKVDKPEGEGEHFMSLPVEAPWGRLIWVCFACKTNAYDQFLGEENGPEEVG